MVFIHIILHKLTRLLASFLYLLPLLNFMNYTKFNVNEIKKISLVYLTNSPRCVVKLPEKKKIPDCRFLCAV